MAYVILVAGFASGATCPHENMYVKKFDHESHGGVGYAEFTEEITEAMQFPDLSSLFEFWKKVPSNKKIREDGKPNRPMTAMSIMPIKYGEQNVPN